MKKKDLAHHRIFSLIPSRAAFDKLGYEALRVLCALGAHSDKSGLCWPSLDYLARFLGMHKSNVSRAIRKLKERGYVTCCRAEEIGNRLVFKIMFYESGHDKNHLPTDFPPQSLVITSDNQKPPLVISGDNHATLYSNEEHIDIDNNKHTYEYGTGNRNRPSENEAVLSVPRARLATKIKREYKEKTAAKRQAIPSAVETKELMERISAERVEPARARALVKELVNEISKKLCAGRV